MSAAAAAALMVAGSDHEEATGLWLSVGYEYDATFSRFVRNR